MLFAHLHYFRADQKQELAPECRPSCKIENSYFNHLFFIVYANEKKSLQDV